MQDEGLQPIEKLFLKLNDGLLPGNFISQRFLLQSELADSFCALRLHLAELLLLQFTLELFALLAAFEPHIAQFLLL